MNLEELKKATPDDVKTAGFTEQEWQQFLKDYQAYQDSLHRKQGPSSENDPLNKRGVPGGLNTSPRLVEPASKAGTTSLPNDRGQPPPGFREALHPWTTRPQPKE